MYKRFNSKHTYLMIASVITSFIYIGWRILFTIPINYGLISLIAGSALVIAETIGVIEAFSHYKNMSHAVTPEKPEIPIELYPEVDVLIATHSESTQVLYKTINGCIHMKYPHRGRVHIYLCDDSNRPEMEALAKQMGIHYFGVVDNKFAKAGNLNHALARTTSPLIVTFDADMIPTHDFLLETVPYFFLPKMIQDEDGVWRVRTDKEIDPNYKIGFIQTPQSFYNADLFQFNLFAEKNIPNEQDYFFREINVGRNRTNSAIYAGSNTVIAREALEQVGGIRTGTITEDFATGIDIQSNGYTCYAIPNILAHGLAPNDFKSLIKQRQRWGRGCIQTLRSFKFLFGKVPIRTKLSYVSCFLYWWTFLRRFIYIMSPILFVVFGIVVVDCSLWELICIWLPSYIIYNQALKVLSGNIRNQKWSNIVDTIIFPYMIMPILLETLGIKLKKFAVTSKEKVTSRNAEIRYAIPHMILFGASLIGLFRCIRDMIDSQSIGGIVILYWLVVNLYFLAMSIIFMIGRINFRHSERFYSNVDATISLPKGEYLGGSTYDLSEGGLSMLLDSPVYIPYDCAVKLEVNYLDYHAMLDVYVVHVVQMRSRWKYSFRISEITEENKRQYYQIVFDRNHTLPVSISSGVVKDIMSAVKGYRQSKVMSNRKLPRIPLNMPITTIDGRVCTLIEYNYEYLLLGGLDYNTELKLRIEDEGIIHCNRVSEKPDKKAVLYHIENWREVAESEKVNHIILNHWQFVENKEHIRGVEHEVTL